jgi:hypothetical protein
LLSPPSPNAKKSNLRHGWSLFDSFNKTPRYASHQLPLNRLIIGGNFSESGNKSVTINRLPYLPDTEKFCSPMTKGSVYPFRSRQIPSSSESIIRQPAPLPPAPRDPDFSSRKLQYQNRMCGKMLEKSGSRAPGIPSVRGRLRG